MSEQIKTGPYIGYWFLSYAVPIGLVMGAMALWRATDRWIILLVPVLLVFLVVRGLSSSANTVVLLDSHQHDTRVCGCSKCSQERRFHAHTHRDYARLVSRGKVEASTQKCPIW